MRGTPETFAASVISSDIGRHRPKQMADGREQTQTVFRANGQKTGRLAKGRKNPQTDEERAWGIPASQPFASAR